MPLLKPKKNKKASKLIGQRKLRVSKSMIFALLVLATIGGFVLYRSFAAGGVTVPANRLSLDGARLVTETTAPAKKNQIVAELNGLWGGNVTTNYLEKYLDSSGVQSFVGKKVRACAVVRNAFNATVMHLHLYAGAFTIPIRLASDYFDSLELSLSDYKTLCTPYSHTISSFAEASLLHAHAKVTGQYDKARVGSLIIQHQ